VNISDTTEHKIWCGMRRRCNNPRNKLYPYYGGRGIKVCKRWEEFSKFLADMGLRPSARHSIDRFPDNDGPYAPGNCRWATREEQMGNRRSCLYVTHGGKTLCVAEWARRTGLTDQFIRRRVKRGLIGAAIFGPPRLRGGKLA
jgi:hypothetical protein